MSRWHYFLCYPLPLWSLLATAAALLWLSLSLFLMCVAGRGKKRKAGKSRERETERELWSSVSIEIAWALPFPLSFFFPPCSLGNKIQQKLQNHLVDPWNITDSKPRDSR